MGVVVVITNEPVCMCEWVVWGRGGCRLTDERYLGCHIHVDTLVSSRIQSEVGGCGCDNQRTCVHV
jgi:hypothetical protein